MKIDGKTIAAKILNDLKNEVQKLNITPHLAIILVGNDPASIAYIEQKDLKAEKIGAKTSIKNLSSDISQSDLISTIQQYNNNNNIHGIIVQRPLPSHIDSRKVSLAIDPKKDVDGFHPNSKFQPPISLATLEILKSEFLKDKNIAVIGKGETGGQPIIQIFNKMGLNPTVIDSKTENKQMLIKKADIIISAVGKPNIIKPEMIKKDAILIGIGLHKGHDGKLHGDYEEEQIKDNASFYTPTPGGVGPVNVAMLLSNVIKAAKS